MDAGRIRNVSHWLARVGIDHDDVCGAGDVYTPRRTVEGKIIPATVATERVGVDEVVIRSGCHGECGRKQHRQNEAKELTSCEHDVSQCPGYLLITPQAI